MPLIFSVVSRVSASSPVAMQMCSYTIRIAQKLEGRLEQRQLTGAGGASFLEQRLEVAVLDAPAFLFFWRLGIKE